MGTRSRERIYGASIRASAERATQARKAADKLACEAWNQRMLGYKGPAQPSPALGDALNAGYCYLEVRCLGCDTHTPDRRAGYRTPAEGNTDFISLNAVCAAGIAPGSAAIPTSAVISSRCARQKFRPTIHRRRGSRVNGEVISSRCREGHRDVAHEKTNFICGAGAAAVSLVSAQDAKISVNMIGIGSMTCAHWRSTPEHRLEGTVWIYGF